MLPTTENWMALVNSPIQLDPRLVARPTGSGVREIANGLEIDAAHGSVSLRRVEGPGSGLWVPYAETQAVVGYASGGQSFVASGPFSGCEFAVGRCGDRVFAAHIAWQSGSTAVQDFDSYVETHGLKTWYRNRIPLPSDSFYACSYVFASFLGDGLRSLVRIDVKVTSMGGGNGTIFNVKKFK